MTDTLSTAVATSFGGDAAAALGILMTYGNEPYHRDVEQVRAALVVLAKGDLARLRHFTARARQDYRDVLMWAASPPAPRTPAD